MGRKLKLSYNYNTENQSMLSSVLFTCSRAGDEEKQQAALWLIGEQPIALSGLSSRGLHLSCQSMLIRSKERVFKFIRFFPYSISSSSHLVVAAVGNPTTGIFGPLHCPTVF